MGGKDKEVLGFCQNKFNFWEKKMVSAVSLWHWIQIENCFMAFKVLMEKINFLQWSRPWE